ncbi:MAG: hypothetical protein WA949_17325 [Phormidesmis sp.]
MARAKKASRILNNAEKRLAGMKIVNPKLSFGEGISVPDLEKQIVAFREKLATYNQQLSQVDEIYDDVINAERDIYKLSSNLLAGVGIKYGKDSSEYETVRGARLRRRRRPSDTETIEIAPETEAATQPQLVDITLN